MFGLRADESVTCFLLSCQFYFSSLFVADLLSLLLYVFLLCEITLMKDQMTTGYCMVFKMYSIGIHYSGSVLRTTYHHACVTQTTLVHALGKHRMPMPGEGHTHIVGMPFIKVSPSGLTRREGANTEV